MDGGDVAAAAVVDGVVVAAAAAAFAIVAAVPKTAPTSYACRFPRGRCPLPPSRAPPHPPLHLLPLLQLPPPIQTHPSRQSDPYSVVLVSC